jgi:hypothetical protein
MRAGLTVSIIGHAAILGIGLIAFPDMRPFQVEEIEALPVELIDVADETDLLKGDENAEIAPEETPQPVAEVEAPTPEPVEEKVAEKPVEAARTPTPPPPPPPPEPEPEPDEIAALPEMQEPLPEPEPEPEPAVEPEPQPAPVPRARPNPPKQVVQPPREPAPEQPQDVARPEQPKPEFNADEITALLNKQTPAGGGAPTPAAEPQTIGSIDGQAEAAMTQSEIAALKAKLYACWSPPVAVREAAYLIVEVRITLLPDGSLAGSPEPISVTSASDPLAQVAVEAAVRAVQKCAPFGDILRPEKYALWNKIDFVFDPREMLGG